MKKNIGIVILLGLWFIIDNIKFNDFMINLLSIDLPKMTVWVGNLIYYANNKDGVKSKGAEAHVRSVWLWLIGRFSCSALMSSLQSQALSVENFKHLLDSVEAFLFDCDGINNLSSFLHNIPFL